MDILLATINARYHHTSLGLRYLFANLAELQPQSEIVEFVLGKNPRDIAETLLAKKPKIIGLGVYIWNTNQTFEVISHLKKISPEVILVLGGPEISYESEKQNLFPLTDYVIQGESEFLFRDLCREILNEEVLNGKLVVGTRPEKLSSRKLISGSLPEINDIKFPYDYYSNEDLAHRVIYVEASRGCPYKCEYCLSSMEESVRNFDVNLFLAETQKLLDRGARNFKFLDRTFNLRPSISCRILEFFLERRELGLFLHFEMVPDRLPEEIRTLIKKFPKGSLQFEIGVQTWSPIVATNVSRRQDYLKIEENFQFLREQTGVHTHADLIVGLPGETKESFARGFDVLAKCEVDEIQVGILKRLKGTPIIRHDQEYEMVYSDQPPFQILKNKDIDFFEMQKFNRFAQFWDLYANSGNFGLLMNFLKRLASEKHRESLFEVFWDFSQFLNSRHAQTHAISRGALMDSAEVYLVKLGLSPEQASEIIRSSSKAQTLKSTSRSSARQQKHAKA